MNGFTPIKIIYNGVATVVFWNDDTKTVVKRSTGTKDDRYNAFCAALAKKMYGTNSALKKYIECAENAKNPKPKERPLKWATVYAFWTARKFPIIRAAGPGICETTWEKLTQSTAFATNGASAESRQNLKGRCGVLTFVGSKRYDAVHNSACRARAAAGTH